MEQKKEKGLRIRSCLTGAIWLALAFSTVISALLFAFLNHFFNLPSSIPVLGWLLIFNTLIAGLITSFINARLLEPITRLSKAMKEVSQGDFEQHISILPLRSTAFRHGAVGFHEPLAPFKPKIPLLTADQAGEAVTFSA